MEKESGNGGFDSGYVAGGGARKRVRQVRSCNGVGNEPGQACTHASVQRCCFITKVRLGVQLSISCCAFRASKFCRKPPRQQCKRVTGHHRHRSD